MKRAHGIQILILLVLVYPSASFAIATATYVQGCVNSASAGNVSCAMGSNITAGNLLVVRSKTESLSNSTPTVTSSAGVSLIWNVVSTSPSTCENAACTFFLNGTLAYAVIPTTGAESVHVSWTATSGNFTDISVSEYSASAGWLSSPLDQSQVSTSGASYNPTASCNTGTTGTLSQTDELVIANCETWTSADTWTPSSGFTDRPTSDRNTDAWFDKSVSATTSQSFSFGIASDTWVARITTFKMKPRKIFHKVIQD